MEMSERFTVKTLVCRGNYLFRGWY